MGISRIALSSIQTLNKSDSFLDGNPPYIPSSYESIATLSPSAATTTTFSSIPSTYSSLQIRANLIASTADSVLIIRLNGDSTTAYSRHALYANGGVVSAGGTAPTGSPIIIGFGARGAGVTYPTVGIVDLIDYASTTKYKTGRSMFGYDDNSTAGDIELNSFSWRNTAAVTSITISIGTGTFTGSVALYGVK